MTFWLSPVINDVAHSPVVSSIIPFQLCLFRLISFHILIDVRSSANHQTAPGGSAGGGCSPPTLADQGCAGFGNFHPMSGTEPPSSAHVLPSTHPINSPYTRNTQRTRSSPSPKRYRWPVDVSARDSGSA
ncbi:hypothetical protein CTheo_2540 [Ceratobasidium theobromae]|uniref:Uncharacterized protein n=1 Tax=Ceratobasidium theobromae TaxID=1582974 RepID=A0A5N5QR86_9AGAM|nr:hypothetical protein CTheo_2540 [Ceratobasidium theobromae]